jgi:hypothetical protein
LPIVSNNGNKGNLPHVQHASRDRLQNCISPQHPQITGIGAHTRFTPGHTPFNKGKKMPAETKAKLKFFDKGHVPHNIRPDFSERVSNDGYVEIKVPNKGFQLKHRYLWESIHGAIPHGCIVTFIDGDKMNVKIENLQLITKGENMHRNNINRFPQELINAIRQNSKLKTHINAKQNR